MTTPIVPSISDAGESVIAARKLVIGVGINDSEKPISGCKRVGSRRIQWTCPFYKEWSGMLRRCYSEKALERRGKYKGCEVCEEWKVFSNFRDWMESQDWAGNQLDKDIIVEGNNIYSPETCAFVSHELNKFLCDSGASRGKWPIGAYFHKGRGMFKAQCSNPFTKKREHLGFFATPEEASIAWLKKKHEISCLYAAMQSDIRVSNALMSRFSKAMERTP